MEIQYLSLSNKVYEYLSNEIIEGNIKYGEKLNIKALSERLKVSTMPVRDALKKLEMENVVQINPRSNCIIKVPTKKSILDAFAMRELLEMHTLEIVCKTVTQEKLTPMFRIVKYMDTIVQGRQTNSKVKRYIHLDQLLHTELCVLSDNDYLQKFYREVILHLNMTFTYQIGVRPDINGTFKDHKRLVDLLSKNSSEALAVLKKHLEQSKSNIVNGDVFQSLEKIFLGNR